MRTIAFAAPTLIAALAALPASAAVLSPTGITTSTLSGTNSPTAPFTDDVQLDSLTFGSGGSAVTYSGTGGNFSAADSFEVLQRRNRISADWGDNDDGADGNDNPFAKAGFAGESQTTTDPTIQDAALLAAFDSLVISEVGNIGGGSNAVQFEMTFQNTLRAGDVSGDSLPDIVFFERGGNDAFSVELMLAGSGGALTYSTALAIDSRNFWDTGVAIDTVSVGSSQNLFAGGFDFSDWGLGVDDVVTGFRLTSTEGPDLGGVFLTAANASIFDGGPAPVPLPAGVVLLLTGLAGLGGLRARRRGGW